VQYSWMLRRCGWWMWPLAYAYRRLTSSTRARTLRRLGCRMGALSAQETMLDYESTDIWGPPQQDSRWLFTSAAKARCIIVAGGAP
jgi:hypothetical protein